MKPFAALACLCLLPWIASCGTEPVVVTEIRYDRLPDAYLVPCEYPTWQGGTWLDAPALALKRGTAIRDCNDRLREAREYQRRQIEREAANRQKP